MNINPGQFHTYKSLFPVQRTQTTSDHLAVEVKKFDHVVVGAIVTAGTRTSGLRTGIDEGTSVEGTEPQDTVNIIVRTTARLMDGAISPLPRTKPPPSRTFTFPAAIQSACRPQEQARTA